MDSQIIKCSSCDRFLLEALYEKGDLAFIQVDCPFCGDSSFKHEITDRYRLGYDIEVLDVDEEKYKRGDETYTLYRIRTRK